MQRARLVSLDALRGATIAAMILVNNPGTWRSIYSPLRHAAWHGFTFTDLIFPAFLFMVGVSLSFSTRAASPRAALRRTALLFALGLMLAAFPFFPVTRLTGLRIPGVLQRIAIASFATWLLARLTGWRGQLATMTALLVGYWLLLTRMPIPDGSAPSLEPGKNLAAWVDRALLGKHLWSQTKTWDPEGPLSTLPAIATTISGALAGRWITRKDRSPTTRASGLLAVGTVLMLIGYAWGHHFPINKNLWTSSYVLLTSGITAALLGLIYTIADVLGYRRWTWPFIVYGENGILAFVGSGLLAKALIVFKTNDRATQAVLYQAVFAPLAPPKIASLLYALANVLFFFVIVCVLHKKKIVVKV